jgi:hypothetical protein
MMTRPGSKCRECGTVLLTSGSAIRHRCAKDGTSALSDDDLSDFLNKLKMQLLDFSQ